MASFSVMSFSRVMSTAILIAARAVRLPLRVCNIQSLLFSIVNVTRKLNLDAEEALQEANVKFMRRFSQIEKKLMRKKMTLKQMDALWDKIKKAEK